MNLSPAQRILVNYIREHGSARGLRRRNRRTLYALQAQGIVRVTPRIVIVEEQVYDAVPGPNFPEA